MSRTFDQIMRSKETDSWYKTFHRYIGTALGGTYTMTVPANAGNEQIFVTGLSFISNSDIGHVHLMQGTSVIYHLYTYDSAIGAIGGRFKDSFETPLKLSQGTSLDILLMGIFGTYCFNINGYKVKH